MKFQDPHNLLFYYKLIFIALLLLLGFCGIGFAGLEYYTDVVIISTDSTDDKQALLAASYVIGTLSFFAALLMIYLMREKRLSSIERRNSSKPLDFINRRSDADRRCK